jgi:hypothetical protein
MGPYDAAQDRVGDGDVTYLIHACQCSTGRRLVMIVALLSAGSSMISRGSERVILSFATMPPSSSASTSVLASCSSQLAKALLPLRMPNSSDKRGLHAGKSPNGHSDRSTGPADNFQTGPGAGFICSRQFSRLQR